MALLTQGDYDGVTAQITNRKRTAGSFNGKVVRDVAMYRLATNAGGYSADPVAIVQLTYTDNSVETLYHAASVELYPVGSK